MTEKLFHISSIFNYGTEKNPILCYYAYFELADQNGKVFYRRDKFTKRGDKHIKTSEAYSICYLSKQWAYVKFEFFKKHGIVK